MARFVTSLLGEVRAVDRVLVYAPKKGKAFEVNQTTWNFLQQIEGQDVTTLATPTAAEQNLIDRLRDSNLMEDSDASEFAQIPSYSPTHLILLPTANCNLRCTYCFSIGGLRKTTITSEMAAAAIDFVLNAIERNNGRSFALSFLGGGEPTLSWTVLQAAWSYAFTASMTRGLTFEAGLTTNGTWNRSRASWIAEHFPKVTISLDGTEPVMEAHRPSSNGKNVFNTVVANVSELVARNCNVGIRSTVSGQSLCDMEPALMLFHSLGVRRVHFEPLSQVGRACESGITAPIWSDFVETFWNVQLLGRKLGIRVTSSVARQNSRSQRYCRVGEKAAILTPNGQLTA